MSNYYLEYLSKDNIINISYIGMEIKMLGWNELNLAVEFKRT